MHESVRARELEKKINEIAGKQGLQKVNKIIIRIGRGEGESREVIEHILKDHMKLKDFQIIEEDIVLVCGDCGRIVDEETPSIRCCCGSARTDILSGMGVEVLNVG